MTIEDCMGAIDFHTHAFPDDLAKRAIASLEGQANWKAVAGGTVKELLASMNRAGVDASAVCAIATKPGQHKGIVKWCHKIASDRIIPLPSVHPDDGDPAKEIDKLAADGFIGIKLHPMYQSFQADDRRLDPIYAACSLHGLLVVLHCGRDVAFLDDDRASPQRIRRVIDRFDGLRLVCTHLGGWRSWDEVREHLVGTPVHMETSFSIGELGADKAAELIRAHGVERVLMGSDWPWRSQESAVADVRSLPLTDVEKDRILWSNAGRLITT